MNTSIHHPSILNTNLKQRLMKIIHIVALSALVIQMTNIGFVVSANVSQAAEVASDVQPPVADPSTDTAGVVVEQPTETTASPQVEIPIPPDPNTESTPSELSEPTLETQPASEAQPTDPVTAPIPPAIENTPAELETAPPASPTTTWPTDGQWVIPVCNDDPSGDESPNSVDLKASGSQYGAAYFTDANNLYIRERVDGNPGSPGNFNQFGWVFMVQSNIASTDYDFLVSLRGSGAGEAVELWQNTSPNGPIDWSPIFNDPAETLLNTWDTSTNTRVTSTSGDYFVDWQIPLSELTARNVNLINSALFFATATDANNFNKDHLNCYNNPDVFVEKSIQKNHAGPWFEDGRDVDIQAAPGDTLTYSVTLTNAGGPATNQAVSDELGRGNVSDGNANVNPASQYSDWTTILNNDSDGNSNSFAGSWGDGSADGQSNDTLSLTVPLLSGGGASESFTFDATVSGAIPVGTSLLENRATVGSRNADTDIEAVRTITPNDNPPLGQACGLDIGLVIDSSGSIDSTELGQMKNAFTGFVDAFLPGTPTQMSVVEYDTNVINPSLAFTDDDTALDNRINAAVSGGWTNWEAGLVESHGLYDPRPAKPDLMIFASDGNPNTIGTDGNSNGGAAGEANAVAAATVAANAIKADGIRIIALGIGGGVGEGEALDVDNLVAISGPNVAPPAAVDETADVILADFDTLATALSNLADELCGGKILVQKQFDTNGDGTPEYDGSVPNAELAGWNFDVNGSPSDPGAQTTADTGSLEFDVLNGTYSATETALKLNTALTNAQCIKGTAPIGSFDPATRTVSGLTMGTDETIACNFINSATAGSVTVNKLVDANGDGAFEGGNSVANALGFDWGLDAEIPGRNMGTTASNVSSGSHAVTENSVNGFHFVGWYPESAAADFSCTDPFSTTLPADITVVPGIDTTVTLCNAHDTGTVTLEKIVQGGTAQPGDWSFTVNGVPGYHSGDQITLPTGYYPISESGPDDYTLTSVSGVCSVTPDSPNATLHVTADGGTCTFTNTRQTAPLTVLKAVDTDGDGDIDIQNATDWTWDLDAGNQNYATGSTQTVTTGLHQVAEDNQGGYHNISWSCWNTVSIDPLGNGVGTTLDVTVPLDGATCLFTNAHDAGTITVHKEYDDDGNGTVDRTNPDGWNWDLVGGAQDNAGGVTLALPTDLYTVTEDPITDYTSAWTCSDQTSGNGTSLSVSLVSEGQNIVCTFRNTRQTGSITVNKLVDTNGDGTFEGGNTEANSLGFDWGLDAEIPGRDMGTTASLVPTGPHTVDENSVPNYHFVGWYPNISTLTPVYSCTNPFSTSLPANLSVSQGQTASLTLCNALDTGTITVNKDFDDDGNGKVDRTNPDGWTWDLVGGAQDNAGGATVTFPIGDVSMTEDAIADYATRWECSDGASGDGTLIATNLGSGENLVCRFQNTRQTGTIRGTKFNDLDGDGVWDAGEPGKAGVTINLSNGWSDSTDENGEYGFELVPTGTYTVSEEVPAGWINTTNDEVTDVVVTAGQETIVNFGNFDKISIGGQKFNDLNYNGKKDDGEPGLPGWTIVLTIERVMDQPPAEELHAFTEISTVTDENGNYAFTDLGPGTYGLSEVQQNGWTQTTPNPEPIVAQSGTDVTGVDFGNFLIPEFSIEVSKTDNTDTTTPGSQLTYEISWSITSFDPVPNVIISDTLPANTVYEANSCTGGISCGEAGGVVTWNLDTITPTPPAFQASGLVAFKANVATPLPNGTVIRNTGQFCYGQIEDKVNGESCEPFSDTTTVQSDFSVDIEKSGADVVNAGADLTYTLNWSVSGNAPVDSLIITDPIPANTAFVSASAGGTEAAGVVTWDLGAHVPGDLGSVTLTVHVNSPLTNGTVLPNTAELCGTVSGIPSDKFTAEAETGRCDSDSIQTTVTSSPIIAVVKSDTPDPVQAGAQLTYTLAWTVTGNSPVTNLVLTDPIPTNTTFVSATNGGAYDAGSNAITWSLGNHVPGDSGSVSFIVTVATPLIDDTILTNTATIDSAENNPVSDTEQTTVASSAALALTKSDDADPVAPGASLTYTLNWSVSGNSPVTNLVLTDNLPTELTFSSASNSGAHSGTNPGGVVTWNLGNHVPGDNGSVTVTAVVGSLVPNGTILMNTASLTSSETDPATAEEDTTVLGAPALVITKTVDASFANPSGQVTYTVIVKNTGTATALNVVVNDVLPDGFVFAATGLKTQTFTVGDLSLNGSKTLTYKVVISTSIAAGTYKNVATAKADNHKPVTAEASLDIRIPSVLGVTAEPKLELTKTVDRTSVLAGGTAIYTLTVKNVGDAPALNLKLTDGFPAGFTLVDDAQSSTKTWYLGDLLPNHERVLNVEVKVAANTASGEYTNTAEVTADNHPPVQAKVDIQVKKGEVLGLATTGPGITDLMVALASVSLIGIGLGLLFFWRRSGFLRAS